MAYTTCQLPVFCLILMAFLRPASCQGLPGANATKYYYESNYHTAGSNTIPQPGAQAWNYADFTTWPPTCHEGKRQSPLSFSNVNPLDIITDSQLRRLKFSADCSFHANSTKMTITNDANVIKVVFDPEGTVPGDLSSCTVQDPLEKLVYHLKSLHFHANSEHKFSNVQLDGELHIDFESKGDTKTHPLQILTIAVLLKASTTINSTSVRALRHILVEGSLPLPGSRTTCFLTEDMPIASMLPSRESYLSYDGSSTFPPCTENVRWVVMTSPIYISQLALGKLRNAMDETLPNDFHRFGNARPPQPLNGRRVFRYYEPPVTLPRGRGDKHIKDVWKAQDAPVAHSTTEAVDFLEGDAFGPWKAINSSEAPANGTRCDASSNATGNATAHVNCEVVRNESSSSEHNTDSGSAASTSTAEPAKPGLDDSNNTTDAFTGKDSNETAAASPTPGGHAKLGNESSSSSVSTSTTAAPTTGARGAEDNSKASPRVKRGTTKASSSGNTSILPRNANKDADGAPVWVEKTRQAMNETMSFIERHPYSIAAGFVGLCFLVFTMVASCRSWSRPSIVAGVTPDELQPLTSAGDSLGYGSTRGMAYP